MRTLVALLVLLGGCSTLLGITDPSAATDGGVDDAIVDGDDASGPLVDGGVPGGGPDASVDASTIDAPPPCIAPPAFSTPEEYALTGTPGALAVGDFNGDGRRDVAVALTSHVVIFHGNAQGGLGNPQDLATAANGLLVGDFDNDAREDLVLWTVGGDRVVARLQDPNQPGGFAEERPLAGPFHGVRRVLTGFLDGAFVPDVLTQDDNERQVYTARPGTKSFAKEDLIGQTGDQIAQIANVSSDGDSIVLVTASGDVQVVSRMGAHFTAPVTVASGATGVAAAFGQLDGDTARDLIVATPAGGVVYRQTGEGTLRFERVAGMVAGATGPTVKVVDVDANDSEDIVVADGLIQRCAGGGFSALVPLATSATTVLRDLDRNDKPELLRIVGQTLEVYRQ